MLPGSSRAMLAAGFLLLVAPLVSSGAALVPLPPELGQPMSPAPCMDLCPDMTVEAGALNPYFTNVNYSATSCEVQEGMTPPGPQKIVRFTSALANHGFGDLLVGNPSGNPENFYYSACHRHWHTRDYADYRVWEPADYQAYKDLRLTHPFFPADQLIGMLPADQQPIKGMKAGWCVMDVRPSASTLPGGNIINNLITTGAKYNCGNMGVSAGYADVYGSGISGQWVVITGVPAGSYLLEVEVNANHHYQELNYWNNSVTKSITIS